MEARNSLQPSQTKDDHKAPKPKHLEVVEYLMSESLSQVVEKYKTLIKGKYVIKEAKTPFIDENLLPDPQLEANASSGKEGITDASPGSGEHKEKPKAKGTKKKGR